MFLSGPAVASGYLASSVVRSRFAPDPATAPDLDRVSRGGGSSAAVAEAVAVVGAAALVWLLIRWQAPGRTTFTNASAIGFLSSQVLTAWASMALWTGAAAVVGHVVPITSRFGRGSSGVTGAFTLLVVFLPLTAMAAVGAWIATVAATRDQRTALPLTFGSVVIAEWVFGVLAPHGPWGVLHGPETILFVAVMAGVLVARWVVDGPRRA